MPQLLRRAIRSDEPLELLALISGLIEATDPRNRNPLDDDAPGPTREELLESFIGTPYAETTGALMVMRSLLLDELTKARINRELAKRCHPMPLWLTRLDDTIAEPSMFLLTHVLNDGQDYLLGVTLPTGEGLSALVYVDANMGTAIKDAFVVPQTLDDLVIETGNLLTGPNASLTRTDPADGRAAVEQAITLSARLWPPVESDTWPMCRPIVEWMLRHLPEGGYAPEPQEWSAEQLAEIKEDFFASRFGRAFDGEDERGLMDNILWFASSYSGSDPYRWSEARVEVILMDWFPRKIVESTGYLAKLPDVLRAYVGYSHDRQEIPADLTLDVLEALDHFAPTYQVLIRSEHAQGAEALAQAVLDVSTDLDEASIESFVLNGLAALVGGQTRLQNLDDAPLPDEPFEWAGVPADIHPVVQEMLESCDRFANQRDDVEYRTAMRRFLSRAAVGDPSIFRRRGSAVRGAAAVAWVISEANGMFTGKFIQESFGLKTSVAARAEPMLEAIGRDPRERGVSGHLNLGAPDLLVSAQRAEIISFRDRALAGFGI